MGESWQNIRLASLPRWLAPPLRPWEIPNKPLSINNNTNSNIFSGYSNQFMADPIYL